MKIELLQPDTAPLAPTPPVDPSDFGQALDALGKVLGNATLAEDAYASGTGSLQEAMYQRAQADIALSVATATAQRAAQAVQTLMNLQI
jgi:flagellar hook-basal body complex protein FliE